MFLYVLETQEMKQWQNKVTSDRYFCKEGHSITLILKSQKVQLAASVPGKYWLESPLQLRMGLALRSWEASRIFLRKLPKISENISILILLVFPTAQETHFSPCNFFYSSVMSQSKLMILLNPERNFSINTFHQVLVSPLLIPLLSQTHFFSLSSSLYSTS